MNHLKIYDDLVKHAKKQKRLKNGLYFENHHIIPKCLGGNNDPENLVLLTLREHFVAHKLLTYIYPEHRGIFLAFHRLCYDKSNKYIATSRDYKFAKQLIKSIPPKSHYQIWLEKYGKEEADKREKHKRDKIQKTMTGVKYSKERIENAAKGHIGIKLSEKTCLKKKESMKGKNTGKRTDKIREKISKSMLGKKNAKKYE